MLKIHQALIHCHIIISDFFLAQRERVSKQNSTTKYEEGEEKEQRRRNSSLSPENSVESPDQDTTNEFIGPVEEESDTDHSEYDSDEEEGVKNEKEDGKIAKYREEKVS